jgi:nucleotide-binding universal stress UspA family protein
MGQVTFEKIVVPLDGSKWAEMAIPHAEQIARGGGELVLLHIYKPAGSEFLGDSALARQTAHLEDARTRAEQYVKGVRGKIADHHINVTTHLVEGNDFPQMVCNFVNAEEADVVVMPAASHRKLVRTLLGDVATKVAGCANACLLLVRGNLEAEWDEESQKILDAREADEAVPVSVTLLEQLTSLYEAGILSKDEFEAKRAQVKQRS